LDCAVKYELIKKSGAWYSYNEEKIGQGRDNTKEYLEQHPDFMKELETKLRAQIFPGREFPKAKDSGKAAASAGTKAAAAPPVEAKIEAKPEAEVAAEKTPVYEAPPQSRGPGRPKKAAASDDALF